VSRRPVWPLRAYIVAGAAGAWFRLTVKTHLHCANAFRTCTFYRCPTQTSAGALENDSEPGIGDFRGQCDRSKAVCVISDSVRASPAVFIRPNGRIGRTKLHSLTFAVTQHIACNNQPAMKPGTVRKAAFNK